MLSIAEGQGVRFVHAQEVLLDEQELSEATRTVFAYWQDCARLAGCDVPGRKDIDPLNLCEALPWIALMDLVGDAPSCDFRLRVLGTSLEKLVGNQTGRLISESVFAARDMGPLQRAVDERRPCRIIGSLQIPDQTHMIFRELHLPLATVEGVIDKVLCFVELERRARSDSGLYRRH